VKAVQLVGATAGQADKANFERLLPSVLLRDLRFDGVDVQVESRT
jgi:hypothetical protein